MFTRLRSLIDHLISTDIGNRGVQRLYFILKKTRPNYLEKSTEILLSSKTVLIVSDFPIPPMMIPETDGPPGALALALALDELGKRAVILTQDIIAEGLRRFYRRVITDFPKEQFSCIVSIETPGRAKDGKYYSFSGMEIKVRRYDELFINAKVPTIGIGDGGNEIGMGNLNLEGKYYSTVKTTELIVAGVSNWGAYGLVAGLSIKTGQNLLRDYEEAEVVKTLVEAGAIDGITKRREVSVDGLPMSIHSKMLGLIKEIIKLRVH
ncbi:glutamate cyclase domain-containing protein [Pyrococcus kukulkanii]|uniref:glutamate cyclase domain-containing protein n=1 Tax=Pyrococcus kukulkanii TaxID=1609559 RepID=UPI002FF6795C